ncbi:hypothetical protein LTR66_014765 [Elasticomyces elasticus]|nr:hypothetical protein LTR66_014765 [Elasticomyces elasticus]
MSQSDLSDSSIFIPDHATLERALRDTVDDIYDQANLSQLTVKRVRAAVERAHDLPSDFFKNDAVWKDKSKGIISAAVDAHSQPSEPVSSPPKQTRSKPKPTTAPKAGKPAAAAATRGKRRASPPDRPKARKRQRKNASEDKVSDGVSDSSHVSSDAEEAPRPRRQAPIAMTAKQRPEESPGLSDVEDTLQSKGASDGSIPPPLHPKEGDSDSELSSVRDLCRNSARRQTHSPPTLFLTMHLASLQNSSFHLTSTR